jgi:hypothetical protein
MIGTRCSIAPDVTSGERAVCSHYSLHCYKPIAEPLDKFINRRKWREPREIVLVV